MERKKKIRDLIKRTALDRSGVARVLDATVTRGRSSSDEGGHGGNGEESDFGEHFGRIVGGSDEDWKVCLFGDDEVGYSTEEIWKQEPWFYRFLESLVSKFIF